MTAAQILGVPFSLTLHGSDLLLNGVYLDTKLQNCAFCLTVSEFNRRHILAHFPSIPSSRVLLHRMGVAIPVVTIHSVSYARPFTVLSVGRLHPVKHHSFLIQGCFFLKEYGVSLRCLIAELGLQDTVELLGQIPQEDLARHYDEADLVALTSHSEGIPLTLMEAMARGRLVLAPSITGIPELIKDGETGFLYTKVALEEFVWRVYQIYRALSACDSVRRAAREHVIANFKLESNLQILSELFEQRVGNRANEEDYEYPVLQQI
jgi:colanic acid/amylovoran biosynthesis glycosyltransferase